MPDSLVETKLMSPRPRPRAVARPRLDDLLQRGADASVLLVSAPAGFGKTTLLGTWFARAGDRPTAWVSLDQRDAEARSFWSYVVVALDRAVPGIATAALDQLRAGQPPLESILAGVLNEISVLPGDLSLVLDDYHLAEGPEIQSGMTFLVEHLPPQLHVVISTRADPVLPLARLRARGELVEVRAADLRFTDAEAATYLERAGLDLADSDVAALESRTEGWAAALQLAALSLQGRDDPERFIEGFAGDDRFVVDYLADEVLDRLPAETRQFLLATSVLDRLTGPLCDAVTGRTGAATMLQTLERQNLFVVPLDDNRRWYRYHHLFADVLRAHLAEERQGDVAALHRRASAWYAEAGQPEAAVRHALSAGDVDRAAELVELAIPELRRHRREDVIRRWAAALPDDAVRHRPVLAVGLIGGLAASNDLAGLDRRLSAAEDLLARPAGEVEVVDRAELSRLPTVVETYRALLSLVAGDLPGTVAHAEAALARAVDDDHLSIAAASALCGLAAWPTGDLATAHRTYVVAAEHLKLADHIPDVLGCVAVLADLELDQGHLRAAEHTLDKALALAESSAPGSAPVRGTADLQVLLSRVAWERGDLGAAAAHLDRAADLGDDGGLPKNPARWRISLAALRDAEGDPDAALELLDEAARVYVGDFAPDVRPVAATRARMLVSHGDLAGARQWMTTARLSPADEPSYLREYELITVARVLLAEHRAGGEPSLLADATSLLDRLLAAADEGGRTAAVIEILVLQAVAQIAAGRAGTARDALQRALRLAEPEGWVRVFTAEASTSSGGLTELLRELARDGRDRPFAGRLLQASDLDDGTPASDRVAPALVDPLSEREIDVLRYLASDLDGPAIARELSVSLSTVRTHTQHIYAKLGVGSRRAAVRRAHQLNLFATHASR